VIIGFLNTAPASLVGGYERFMQAFREYANSEGHTVHTLQANPHIARVLYRTKQPASPTNAPQRLPSNVDVLYTKNEPQDVLWGRRLSHRHGIPLIVGFHSDTGRPGGRLASVSRKVYGSRLYQHLLQSATALHFLRETHTSRIDLPPGVAIHVIPNGVDLKRFSPGQHSLHDPLRVLFVGRLDYQKGVDLLVEAIGLLNALSFKPLHFTLAGDGPLRDSVTEATRRFDNVDWVGHCEDVSSLYKSADLVVAPSRWEMFPLVPAEALASGAPLLISDIPSSEVFAPCTAVSLFNLTARDIADALLSFARTYGGNSARYETARLEAREFAEQSLDGREAYNKLMAAFAETLDSNSSRRSG
jgi:glycosyltransferase involved in cell wall biosynthesis